MPSWLCDLCHSVILAHVNEIPDIVKGDWITVVIGFYTLLEDA